MQRKPLQGHDPPEGFKGCFFLSVVDRLYAAPAFMPLCVSFPLSVGGTGGWLGTNRIQQAWRPDVTSLIVLGDCNCHLAPRLSPLLALMGPTARLGGPPSQELGVTPASSHQAPRPQGTACCWQPQGLKTDETLSAALQDPEESVQLSPDS